ncbi:MAG: hypothetical protein RI967_143 [Planctomycetota bacterium]
MTTHRSSLHARRRGLSLVEILVSVAIVLAVAAVAVPWTAGWLGGRELDQAEDQLSMQLMMARAAAREEGRPVEVVADLEGRGQRVRARFLDGLPVDGGGELPGDAGSADDDEFGEFAASDGSGDEAPAIDASWARLELPRGVRLAVGADGFERSIRGDGAPAFSTRADRPTLAADAALDRARGDADPIDGAATGGTTLAIFLPDGTAIVAPIFMLRTDSGRTRAMQVDRATGRPRAVASGAVSGRDGEDGDADRAFAEESDEASDALGSDGRDAAGSGRDDDFRF